MSRAYTKEEIRKQFINYIRSLVKYWNDIEDQSTEEKLSGLAFSILNIFDGTTIALPAMDIVVRPHPTDKEYHQKENTNWYEDGTVLNDDVILHHIFCGKE